MDPISVVKFLSQLLIVAAAETGIHFLTCSSMKTGRVAGTRTTYLFFTILVGRHFISTSVLTHKLLVLGIIQVFPEI